MLRFSYKSVIINMMILSRVLNPFMFLKPLTLFWKFSKILYFLPFKLQYEFLYCLYLIWTSFIWASLLLSAFSKRILFYWNWFLYTNGYPKLLSIWISAFHNIHNGSIKSLVIFQTMLPVHRKVVKNKYFLIKLGPISSKKN